MRRKPYLELMGCLNWTTRTRPDISYHVSFLCQYMQDPSEAAWEAALGILSYLNNTKSYGLTFDGNQPTLVAYTDSSWSQSPRPFGGHVIFYCGAAVSAQGRKLKLMPQSSAEAETACYATCAKDLRFVQQLLLVLGASLSLPTVIRCDNEAAVINITKPGVTMRTRHYEIWLHYGREQYLMKRSVPEHVRTEKQVADIFTKALDKTTYLRFRDTLLNLPNSACKMTLGV